MSRRLSEPFNSDATNTAWAHSITAELSDRRQNRRHDAQQHVGVVTKNTRLICELINLSHDGAQLSIVNGTVPNVDDPILLVLFDRQIVPATVKWIGPQKLGISFLESLADIEQHVESDAPDENFISRALRLQKSLSR